MALKVVNFGKVGAGLTTVGYRIYGGDGVAVGSRITSGVVEIGTNTGIFKANIALPDFDAIILWDTGEATPRYTTEIYQIQLNSIEGAVSYINKIYNSIRNQGEFFAALMDKMGILEKNFGLEKVSDKVDELIKRDNVSLTNMEEAFKLAASKINVNTPVVNLPAPVVNIPEIPDYTNLIKEIKDIILKLGGEIMKVPKTQKEYSGNFNQLISLLNSLEQRFSSSLNDKSNEIKREVKNIRAVFVKFDVLMSKMATLQDKLNSLDTNDQTIIKSRDSILGDIKRLNQFIYDLVSSPYLKEAKDMQGVMMAFGHLKKNG